MIALVTPRVWTPARRLAGNLLPMAACLPFLVAGLALYRPGDGFARPSMWLLAAFPVAGWIAANFLALPGNAAMRRALARRFGEPPTDDAWFVGFARPSYRGLLDPHEEVGFLSLERAAIRFRGETHEVSLPRESVRNVRFRPNPHSWVGLGRWVSVEGEVDGTRVRLLVEPRERATLLGNRRLGSQMRDRIATWARQPA